MVVNSSKAFNRVHYKVFIPIFGFNFYSVTFSLIYFLAFQWQQLEMKLFILEIYQLWISESFALPLSNLLFFSNDLSFTLRLTISYIHNSFHLERSSTQLQAEARTTTLEKSYHFYMQYF